MTELTLGDNVGLTLGDGFGIDLGSGDHTSAVVLDAGAWDMPTNPDGIFADIDIEAVAEAEISDALRAFKAKSTREDARVLDATDSEFWIAVCFQNRKQKEEFLKKIGQDLALADKYLDGMEVARLLGITLETPFEQMPKAKSKTAFLGMTPEFGESYPE